jgi:ribose-phosphate pyrophosphokinase
MSDFCPGMGGEKTVLTSPVMGRLGIELAKTMSLNYSNQETSVTVGESVRDEDGEFLGRIEPADIRSTQFSKG